MNAGNMRKAENNLDNEALIVGSSGTDFETLINRMAKVLELAEKYGQIDGADHKMWCIDQMVQALLGQTAYNDWRMRIWADDTSYDEGIAP